MNQVHIDHFSDILCIWAYIAQIRIEQLTAAFGEKVNIDYHLYPVFGDVPGKIQKSWSNRGGLPAYNQHVLQVANKFDHVNVHPKVWETAAPQSSLPAHLHLAAVKLAEDESQLADGSFLKYLFQLRHAFFVEAKDISCDEILDAEAEKLRLPLEVIHKYIDTGRAYALVSRDMLKAVEMGINSSPTIIFNEGRQKLAGNVGYRIIEANIRELLDNPSDDCSWC